MSQMNAVALKNGELFINRMDMPVPGPGQVLIKSLACGICGSDMHISRHTKEVFGIYKSLGLMDEAAADDTEILLGHEYAAEIVAYGPGTNGTLPVGTRVTSVPILLTMGGVGFGVTPGLYGAYSEYLIADEALLLPIPDNVPSEAAAITEPLAVGLHAVNRANIDVSDTALVAGCGPIGLAAIVALHLKGVKNIVASDPQASKKEIAMAFGATHYVNPTEQNEVAFSADLAGPNKLIMIECVGIHKLLNGFITRAPAHAKLIVTGLHTTPTTLDLAYATVKEMDVHFSYYYKPEEFAQCLQNIADGKVPWQLMRTGKVGLDGVPEAFQTLLKPNNHIKVIVEPWRKGKLEEVH